MELLITGDFCPTGRLRASLEDGQHDGVFGDLLAIMRASDLAVTNLECPIPGAIRTPIAKTGPVLSAPRAAVDLLHHAGIDLVTLANNHIMDYGPRGLHATVEALEEAGIAWVGAGRDFAEASRPFVRTIGGVRLAVLNMAENEWSTTFGANPGAQPINPVRNFSAIRTAKRLADVVVVITHGGHERYPLPSPRMKELFRFFVDAGADAVINHHTHCISGFEVYNGAPIFYSLGNFLFDSPEPRPESWTVGMAVRLTFASGRLSHELLPFDQCASKVGVVLRSGERLETTMALLDELSCVIADDAALAAAFDEFCARSTRQYRAYVEPHNNRYLHALRSRGLFPSLVSQRQRRLLLNVMRCESHRDVLLRILDR